MFKKFAAGILALSTASTYASENQNIEVEVLGNKFNFTLIDYLVDTNTYVRLPALRTEQNQSLKVNNLKLIPADEAHPIFEVTSIDSEVITNLDFNCPEGYEYKAQYMYGNFHLAGNWELTNEAKNSIELLPRKERNGTCLKLSKNSFNTYDFVDSATPVSFATDFTFQVNVSVFASIGDKQVTYQFSMPEAYDYDTFDPIEEHKTPKEIKDAFQTQLNSNLSQYIQIINL